MDKPVDFVPTTPTLPFHKNGSMLSNSRIGSGLIKGSASASPRKGGLNMLNQKNVNDDVVRVVSFANMANFEPDLFL